ncbi:membrane protein insertion efficiency factor YidD [Methylophilaceae bacterium]|nr:membrane protein insertion efficiency factor YidD [Methylophilaceae bacterium]
MTRFIIFLVKIYQFAFSPFFGNRCRFTPTCSVYTIEALQKYGFSKGLWLSLKRLLRCRPGSKAGFDPIPK